MPRFEKELMTGWEFALDQREHFQQVILPHDWGISAPLDPKMDRGTNQGYRKYCNVGWYRREMEVHIQPGYQYYLDFGGIAENSTLWVNGREAGGRKYAYSSFRVNVTPYIIEGKNEILIKADATHPQKDRWYSGAGIYRTVKWLELEDKHFVEEEIVIQAKSDGQVQIDTGLAARVRATLSGQQSCSDDGKITMQVDNVHLWSAEDPYLYDLQLEMLDGERVTDTIRLKIGFRSVELRPNEGLFVNGQHTILKGICVHQDFACRGIAAKKELWRERLEILKEMGCNAIRPAHHVYSREFLDLCDEMGFYVYEECFDKWKSGLYARYYETEWQKDVEAMIKRDRNRPSIIFWGVGNEVENQGQESMIAILKELTEYARVLDPTRPVSYAMNPHFKRESNIDASKVKDIQKFVDEIDDREIYDMDEKVERIRRIADYVDFISCNYQEQWYEAIHQAIPDKLILGTEVYQYFMGDFNQLQNYTQHNPSLVPTEHSYVMGSMIWTAFDYLGEAGAFPSKGWCGAPIRTNGVKKPMFYVLKSLWTQEPMVHFSVMDYSICDDNVKEHWDAPQYVEHWHFPQFHRVVIPYMIATNCDEVAMYVNDKRYYLSKPEKGMITGFTPWQKGTVRVVGYRDGAEVCEHVVKTPGPAVKLQFAQETITLPAREGYEKLITVEAADEEGNPYFRESSEVRFAVEGPAQIMAVDHGNLMSNEPYNSERVHMYRGKASALIRLDGTTGRVVLSAFADGMYSARIIIIIEGA